LPQQSLLLEQETKMRTFLPMAVATAMVASSCSPSGAVQSEKEGTELAMAAVVIAYAQQCVNKSAPQYYIDKAKGIWSKASENDRHYVWWQLWDGPKGRPDCQFLGGLTRFVVQNDFVAPTEPVRSTQQRSVLTAQITRVEESTRGYFYPLIVVDNQSDQSYSSTEWSCTFFDGSGQAVHEDRFYVNNALPHAKTAKKGFTHTNAAWQTSSCRLIG
jgi:hypothetical protein